jgi:hypothetical protein
MDTSTRVLLPLAVLAGLTLTVNGCAGSPSAPPTTASVAAPTTASPSASASPSVPHYATAPATVRAYYSAINSRNYAHAWHLGGRFTGSSYSAFTAGFQGTAHDEVSILSVTGSVVTASLAARQTDGSVRNYQGTYWVTHGVITRFAVALSSAASSPPLPSSAAPAGCHPTAPSGNCYEPGEYCPKADAGMSGVAGDGEAITCVLESERYHWHPGD